MPDGFNKTKRLRELVDSGYLLKTAPFKFKVGQVYHRQFDKIRQEILDYIVEKKNEIKPDMAIIPCSSDKHQDHQVIHQEGVRGLKGVPTILGYEVPWNHMIQANYFVPLTKGDVEKKIQAIDCYESVKHKPYANHDFIWSWAKFRGSQMGAEYGE
jgi:hypothetical protein